MRRRGVRSVKAASGAQVKRLVAKADGAIAERKLYHPPIDDRPGPVSGIPEVKSP